MLSKTELSFLKSLLEELQVFMTKDGSLEQSIYQYLYEDLIIGLSLVDNELEAENEERNK